MNPIQEHSVSVSDPGLRDGVAVLQATHDEPPAIVSISDIHGYLDRARSALLSLRDRSGHDPIVQTDDTGRLQWANENYILVFNGDLIDRGPANEAVLQMVSRLGAQAPTGRVRVTLGNHEAIALSADHYPYSGWYAGQSDVQDRRALLHSIRDGFVVAAYQGYNYTYAHAGSNEPYDVEETNQQLLAAAEDLLDAIGTQTDATRQKAVIDRYSRVLGTGNGLSPKGEGAGLVWLDFAHLSADAPAQIVGHTKFKTPQQKGQVICQNVIRRNEHQNNPGGETVFVETPDNVMAITRTKDGATRQRQY